MSVVYTGGTFDLLHVGHLELLDNCRRLAGPDGRVVVGLNTDEFVLAYKGRRPVLPYQQRAAILRSLRQVDDVIPNVGGWDSRVTVDEVRPDIVAVGDDWAGRDYNAQMGWNDDWLAERGIRVVFVPRTTGVSTTGIRKARRG